MKIVIDCRFWSETGIGRYTRNLVFHLQKIDKENQYYLLLLKKDFAKVELTKNFQKVLANFKWYGFKEQVKLPKILKELNPDLVHFPHFNVPVFYKGKYVVTIHDLIHQHFRTKKATKHNPLVYEIKRYGYKKVFSHAVKNAAKIISPSDFVKKQLMSEWDIDSKKILVTYEGVEESTINLSLQSRALDFKKIADKFKIKKPFLFYLGNAHPHKNILNLIKSFMILKNDFPEYSLVLSGPDHYFWQQIKKQLKPKDVIFTGFVSEKEMVALYKNAAAFIMPSLEEGFGIPLLEAMACSCPVISSKAASLPEVGSDACVYFDARDEKDMVEKISKVLKSEKLRRELVKKGLKRYKEFSWKDMAKKTLEVYQKSV